MTKKAISILLFALFLGGCSARLGHFSVISYPNQVVSLSDIASAKPMQKEKVTGSSTSWGVSGLFPLFSAFFYFFPALDDAMEDALSKAPGAIALTDVSVHYRTTFCLLFNLMTITVEGTPVSVDELTRRVNSAMKRGDFKSVLELLLAAQKRAPSDDTIKDRMARANYSWGRDLFHKMKYAEAVNKLQAAYKLKGSMPAALQEGVVRDLATAHLHLGKGLLESDPKAALEAAQKASALKPGDARIKKFVTDCQKKVERNKPAEGTEGGDAVGGDS